MSTKSRKKRKSPAAVAKRRAKRAARKSHRKGKMPAGLARWHAAQKAGKTTKRRKSRGRKSKARQSRKRSKSRARRRTRTISAPTGTTVVVKRRASKRRGRYGRRTKSRTVRRVKINAHTVTLASTVLGLPANLSATFKGGAGAWLAAVGGAAGAVVGGTFLSRLTNGLAMRFAPALLSHPIGSRGLGALNYLLPAYALAKYTPKISGKTRRAIQAGGMLAAVVEAIRPGMVRSAMASLPMVGGMFGGQLSGLADYVAAGLGESKSISRNAAAMLTDDGDDDDGLNDYLQQLDAVDGMGDVVAFSGE